ncbi:Hypothetical protein ABZS17G119_02479 [Kosakonia cowanii]
MKQDISSAQLVWRKQYSAARYQMQHQKKILCLTYTGFHLFDFP